MKNISEISIKDIEKYRNKTFDVYEKLDMIYFKIKVRYKGFDVFTARGRKIGKIDVIVNDVYREIMEFAESFAESVFNYFGEMSIGFFYLPARKTKSITYGGIDEGSFILSDYYISDKSRRDDQRLVSMIDGRIGDSYVFIYGKNGKIGPYIGKSTLGEWFSIGMDQSECARMILEGTESKETFSGNGVTDIEGLVIRDGSKSYSVAVKSVDPYIEPSSKLIYRDTFLESFVHSIGKDVMERILSSDKDYVGKICDLFMEYVNSSDFFKTMWIEENDLLPPTEGYIGKMSYDLLPPIVSLVCRKDPIYKNALRTLLVTFSSGKTFDRFNDEEKEILIEISEKSLGVENKNK